MVIAFEFASSISCFADILCGMMADSLVDALAAMAFASGIGVVAVLADANLDPRPQQLLPPDFAMIPHLGHTEPIIVVIIAAGVCMEY